MLTVVQRLSVDPRTLSTGSSWRPGDVNACVRDRSFFPHFFSFVSPYFSMKHTDFSTGALLPYMIHGNKELYLLVFCIFK